MPSMSRAVVPEFPQLRRDAGREMREARTVTVEPSRMDEMSAPSCRRTRAVLLTSRSGQQAFELARAASEPRQHHGAV